jgi:hypothetical protein
MLTRSQRAKATAGPPRTLSVLGFFGVPRLETQLTINGRIEIGDK